MEPRERMLVEACAAGQTDAFAELIRPYQDRLYNMLCRMLGQPEVAAEVFQETLIRAFRGLGSFHGDSAFYTWLYRIAVNLALTQRRKPRLRTVRIAAGGRGEAEDAIGDVAAPVEATSPLDALERRERQDQVQKALDLVPEPFRMALVLREIEGLSYEEIADILELPIGTVRSRLFRARAELKEQLRAYWEDS